ncbi:MAG: hypothetical protein ABR571_18325 [Jatrophihabitans sp.]
MVLFVRRLRRRKRSRATPDAG